MRGCERDQSRIVVGAGQHGQAHACIAAEQAAQDLEQKVVAFLFGGATDRQQAQRPGRRGHHRRRSRDAEGQHDQLVGRHVVGDAQHVRGEGRRYDDALRKMKQPGLQHLVDGVADRLVEIGETGVDGQVAGREDAQGGLQGLHRGGQRRQRIVLHVQMGRRRGPVSVHNAVREPTADVLDRLQTRRPIGSGQRSLVGTIGHHDFRRRLGAWRKRCRGRCSVAAESGVGRHQQHRNPLPPEQARRQFGDVAPDATDRVRRVFGSDDQAVWRHGGFVPGWIGAGWVGAT